MRETEKGSKMGIWGGKEKSVGIRTRKKDEEREREEKEEKDAQTAVSVLSQAYGTF